MKLGGVLPFMNYTLCSWQHTSPTAKWLAVCTLLAAVASSSCGPPRPLITLPLAPSVDSIGTQVVHELWRFYSALPAGRPSTFSEISACVATAQGGSAADACVAGLSSRTEDTAYFVHVMTQADSLAERLGAVRESQGAHTLLDETLFFVHTWRRSREALDIPLAACSASTWWCDAMQGLAHHRLGEVRSAEIRFVDMFAQMSADQACKWRMLPALPRSKCSHSDPVTDSLMWWLADPLWLDEGNDRWTEHVARLVLNDFFAHHRELMIAHGYTTKQSRSSRGFAAEAMPVLATRYGMYFLMVWQDVDRPRIRRGEPRLVVLWDLSGPRYEFLPLTPERFARVTSADSSRLGVWPAPFPKGAVSCPNRDCLTRPGAPMLLAQRMFTSRGLIRNVTQPWLGSAEAYGRHQRFGRVTEFQALTMPRGSGRRLLAAFETGSVQLSEHAGVAFSRTPTDSVVRIRDARRESNVVRVSGMLPAEGGVMSLEAVDNERQAWRHRYFLAANDDSVVSRIALLNAEAIPTDASQTMPAELPVELLLARQWLQTSDKISFYWEVVGKRAAGDAALEFTRLDRSTWGQLLGMFRGTADGQTVRVEVGALEPMVRGENHAGFSLPFALSSLEPGRYTVRAVVRTGVGRIEHVGAPTQFELRQ